MLQKTLRQRSKSEDEGKWLNLSATHTHRRKKQQERLHHPDSKSLVTASKHTSKPGEKFCLRSWPPCQGESVAHWSGQLVVLFAWCHLREPGSRAFQSLGYGSRWNQVCGLVSKLFWKSCYSTAQSLVCRLWAASSEVLSFPLHSLILRQRENRKLYTQMR